MDQKLKVGRQTESSQRWARILASRASSCSSSKTRKASKPCSSSKARKVQKPNPLKRKSSQLSRGSKAKERLGGHRAERIGEASHPGPADSLTVCSFNSQGGPGIWRFARLSLQTSEPDVILFQEASFTENESSAFGRYAAGTLGYCWYHQAGSVNARNLSGGVGILVRKGIPQRLCGANSEGASQGIFVWVDGTLFGSLYAPPHEDEPTNVSSIVLKTFVSHLPNDQQPWFLGGDWNETPQQSHAQDVIEGLGGTLIGLGSPTRWGGNREIDFFFTNQPLGTSDVVALPECMSDHKALRVDLCKSVRCPQTGFLPKGPSFLIPDKVSPDVWQDTLEKFWQQQCRESKLWVHFHETPGAIQETWDLFQHTLRETFVAAHSCFSQTRFCGVRHKGAAQMVAWRSQPVRPDRSIPDSFAEKKLRRRLARYHELARILKARAVASLNVQQDSEMHNLMFKLGLEPQDVSLRSLLNSIRDLTLSLRQMEDSTKERRLAAWRHRMCSDSAAISSWLKAKQSPGICALISSDGQVLDNFVDGATAIHDYWTKFWAGLNASIPPLSERLHSLKHGVPGNVPQVDIPCPSGVELRYHASKCTGCGGPDGWGAKEIKHLPLDAFDFVAQYFQRCVNNLQAPDQFTQSRMVCLPKPNKISKGTIDVSDCRPITIMPAFWRLWCSAICRSPHFKSWVSRTFDDSVAGLQSADIYTTIMKIMDEFDSCGFLLELDYTKAFDCMCPQLSAALLVDWGWPPQMASFLLMVWNSQKRYIQWGGHTHPVALQSTLAQPQGDPFGPVLMSLWVFTGVRSTRQLSNIPSFICTYLDDRSICSSSSSHLHHLQRLWQDWSHSVGLLESPHKSAVTGRTSSQRTDLAGHFTTVSVAVRVLGSSSVGSQHRRYTSDESARLIQCRRVIRLLSTIGLPFSLLLRYIRQFALSKANFGWICRSPTWTSSKSLFTATWRATRVCRFASPWLRSLFFGGNLHLDVTWCTRLVAGLLRGSPSFMPRWSLRHGTVAHTLHRWLCRVGWSLVSPWKWFHPYSDVSLDLSPCLNPSLVPGCIGLAQHNIRTAWRAHMFKKWSESSRHEVHALSPSRDTFLSIDWDATRAFALSSASARAVALGSTYSPANYRLRDPSSCSCIWPGCNALGSWSHITWECPVRPRIPPLPNDPFLARFGWVPCNVASSVVSPIQDWLTFCQCQLWSRKST